MRPTHAIALAFAALASVGPAIAQEAAERPLLTVQGVGVSKAKPDVARLSAMVVTRAPDLQAAADAHGPRAAKAADALARLKDKGVTVGKSTFTLRTERIDQPGYPQPMPRAERRERETEGVAGTRFDIEVRPVDAIDDVVTALAVTGVLEVGQVDYALDDPKAETDKARALAMGDARAQARVYAESGGFRLGGIQGVTGGGQNARVAHPMAMSAMAQSRAMPMQSAAPATIDTEANVSVSWRILATETKP